MKLREEHYIAGALFLVTFFVYRITVAVTVSFWDCGEFIACSNLLAVPHPPGAPLYLLIGRIFSMIPFASSIAFRVNIISVLTSCGTIVLLYMSILIFIRSWRGKESDLSEKVIVHGSAVIGALTFAFSDTFWFNAVEAEVYAVSMFLSALVLWLALVWMENWKDHKSSRFLMFAVYLFGLAAGVHLLNLLLIPSILFLIIITDRELLKNINLWALVPVLLFIGFSTYVLIFIRSGLNPPIDENNPETWVNFMKYMKREQYGVDPGLTMFDRKAPFWSYQINKMYIRYFGWQFIGKGGVLGPDNFVKDNISFTGLMGLPFLLGLIGMAYHFVKDKLKAVSVWIIFFFTGVAIVIYLNQPDPQPRERDYVFVGSYYAFAIWIGMCGIAIFDMLKKYFDKINIGRMAAAVGILALCTAFGPVNQFTHNKFEHDRSNRYIDYDYSFNLLESCEPNSVLFTNGDNDTFPLWYLQYVEKIRTDVKVVNLSLLNTPWYNLQLKNEWDVPISYTDQQISGLTPMLWEETKTFSMNVSPEFRQAYLEELKNAGEKIESIPEKMSIEVQPTYAERFIRVQDIMILNILSTNKWKLPIYFAVTVPNSNMVGLRKFMRMDGLAMKILPIENPPVNFEFLKSNLYEKFKFRQLDDPGVYLDYQTTGLVQNLRSAFLQLSVGHYIKNNKETAASVLDEMHKQMPENVHPIRNNTAILQIGQLYKEAGRPDELRKRLDYLMENDTSIQNWYEYAVRYYKYQLQDNEKAIEIMKEILNRDPNYVQAVSMLRMIYDEEKRYEEAVALIEGWLVKNPVDSGAINLLNSYKQKIAERESAKKDSTN